MTILIADDEELVRVGLRNTLYGIKPAAEIIEAVNGRELISRVKSCSPDVCFVDIRMPGITGLQAIEQLAEEYSDISWIILSGYSDFDYARTALGLGVIDYLLKPAVEDEIEAALNKAAVRQQNNGRLRREKFEYRVGGVLNNSSAVEFDDYIINIVEFSSLVFLPILEKERDLVLFQKDLFSELRTLIDKKSRSGYAGLFNILDGIPAVISGGENSEKILHEIEMTVTEKFETGYKLIFSPVRRSLSQLLAYFETAAVLKAESTSAFEEENLYTSSKIVHQAEKFVLAQYNEPIGVAQIAEQLGITPNYLSSLFKKYKNVSFTKYITDIRLNEAPKLLEIPGITVKETASRLGYMSSRHFARLFREKYGKSPSDYRK